MKIECKLMKINDLQYNIWLPIEPIADAVKLKNKRHEAIILEIEALKAKCRAVNALINIELTRLN